jgi:hypothetical protein
MKMLYHIWNHIHYGFCPSLYFKNTNKKTLAFGDKPCRHNILAFRDRSCPDNVMGYFFNYCYSYDTMDEVRNVNASEE